MDEESAQDTAELLAILKRRKHELDKQDALLGPTADPHVDMEREDLARQIQSLEAQLASSHTPPHLITRPIAPSTNRVWIMISAVLAVLVVVLGALLVLRSPTSPSTGLSPLSSENDTAPTTESSSSESDTAPTTKSLITRTVSFPDGQVVTMTDPTGQKFRYEILDAVEEPQSPDQSVLHLRVRAWTDAGGGMNFWSDSFRLKVGERSIAPFNDLNVVVNRDETQEGDVEFPIDSSVSDAILNIKVGGLTFPDDSTDLHVTFQ